MWSKSFLDLNLSAVMFIPFICGSIMERSVFIFAILLVFFLVQFCFYWHARHCWLTSQIFVFLCKSCVLSFLFLILLILCAHGCDCLPSSPMRKTCSRTFMDSCLQFFLEVFTFLFFVDFFLKTALLDIVILVTGYLLS